LGVVVVCCDIFLQQLADGIIPNEYGMDPHMKLKIGSEGEYRDGPPHEAQDRQRGESGMDPLMKLKIGSEVSTGWSPS